MPPITKFKGKQIKEQAISDALIGPRTIESPQPSTSELLQFNTLTDFMQNMVNRLKYLQNICVLSNSSGLILIQVEKTINGFGSITYGSRYYWKSCYWLNPIAYMYYDLYDENIDANSIVEVIPLDSDSDIIIAIGMKLRTESHSGFVRIYADNYPYNLNTERSLNVKLNIIKQNLKENQYVMEYYILYYSPTGKKYGCTYWVNNNDPEDVDFDAGISPLPPQSSTRPAGVSYNKYFVEYFDNGFIHVSGNVLSIEINGILFSSIQSYNETYNYTIFNANVNPFPVSDITGIVFDSPVLVTIIFNE